MVSPKAVTRTVAVTTEIAITVRAIIMAFLLEVWWAVWGPDPPPLHRHAGLGSEPCVRSEKGTFRHLILPASCRLKSAQGDERPFRLRQEEWKTGLSPAQLSRGKPA